MKHWTITPNPHLTEYSSRSISNLGEGFLLFDNYSMIGETSNFMLT